MLRILLTDLGFPNTFSFESYHMNSKFDYIGVEDEMYTLFSKG